MDEEPKADPLRLAAEPRRYESVDGPSRPGDGTAISVQLFHAKNKTAEKHPPVSLRDAVIPEVPPGGFAPRSVNAVNPAPGTDEAGAISVDQILRQNLAKSAEPRVLAALPVRPSRRRQDFFTILIVAGLSAVLTHFLFKYNPMVEVLIYVSIGFVTLILTFLIYGMMDKY